MRNRTVMGIQLDSDVRWFDLGSVNCFLVEDDGVLTLVDAGMPSHADDVESEIEAAGHAVADVERILITHYDFDHVGSLSKLPDLDAPVYVGEADTPLLTGAKLPRWWNHKGLLQLATRPFLDRPELTIRPVRDGDTVGSFTAYHTPGHTPGHTVFLSESLGVAFLGDLVREKNGRLEASPWIVSYDTDRVDASVRSLADRAPDFEVAAMGHGVPFEHEGSERLRELARSL